MSTAVSDLILLKRTALECGWCGDAAIFADEDGVFDEDDGGECVSCGFPGHVEIEDYDEEEARAYWSYEDDEATVVKWAAEHPEAAQRLLEENCDHQIDRGRPTRDGS